MIVKINIIVYVILVVLTGSCGHNNSEINDPRYAEHNTYSAFLSFLREKVDTIKNENEKVAYIRQKTAEIIDAGIGTRDIELLDENWTSWDGEDYYSAFLHDAGTVKCGGSSFFLEHVYEDLGYVSVTYDMGCPDVFTHQVTLVQLSDGKYYIQDAHYNMTFKDKTTNKTVAFEDMLLKLYSADGESIEPMVRQYDYIPTWDTTGFQSFIETHPFAKKLIDSIGLDTTPNYSPDRYSTAMMAFSIKQIHDNCLGNRDLPNELKYMYMIPNQNTRQDEVIKIIDEVIEKPYQSND